MSNMRQFKVKVNGKVFDVEVEDLGASGTMPIGVAPVKKTPVPAHTPAAAAPSQPAPAGGPDVTTSPMAAKILSVAVKVGDSVKAGDTLVVLEAMKMETNVNAGADGVVKEVMVAAGDMVEAGAPLVRCE
jgi:biotin carboxyl carrier protein